MTASLEVRFAPEAASYFKRLDKNTKKRIADRLQAIAADPNNTRLSYPLSGSQKRSTRIGKYRVLMILTDGTLLVSDIGPRGQIYREAPR